MYRSTLLALPLLLSGCASAPPSGVPETREERSLVAVRVDGVPDSNLQLTRDAAIRSESITAAPDEVWAAVPRAFQRLELPITGVNTGNRVLTTTGQRLRRIGGKSVGTFFECPGPYGNAAGSSDVYVTVATQVLPGESDGASTVRIEVDAMARSATSARQVPCSSKGGLEALLVETLQAEVSGG